MKKAFLFLVSLCILALSCQDKDNWIVRKLNTRDLNIAQAVDHGENIEFSIWGTLEHACWEFSHKDSLLQSYDIYYDFYKKMLVADRACADVITNVEIMGAFAPPRRGTYTFHFSDGDTAYTTVTVEVR